MKPTPFIILSGPSGVGKTTMMQRLLKDFPFLTRVVTTTTRPQRPGESHAVDYFFVSPQAFLELKNAQAFMETNEFGSAAYGTPRSILHMLEKGKPLIALPDINGAVNLKKHIPHALCIWLEAPLEILAARLAGRGTETAAQQECRLLCARGEMADAHKSGIYSEIIDMSDGERGYARLVDIFTYHLKTEALHQDR